MNAFALRAADGQVYAYACSKCKHVGSHGRVMWPDTDDYGLVPGPIQNLVMSSKQTAEQCCRCVHCHCVVEATFYTLECAACATWSTLCRVFGRVMSAFERGITTREAWTMLMMRTNDYGWDADEGSS